MFHSLIKWYSTLKEKYPFHMNFKNELTSFLKFTTLLMFLFYLIGFFSKSQNILLFFGGFFLTLFLTFLFNFFLNQKIILLFINPHNWCLWKELSKRLLFLLFYTFNSIWYINFSLNINFSKVDFVQFLSISFIIGSVPILFKVFITKNKLLKTALSEAHLLQQKITSYQNTVSKKEKKLVLTSNIVNETFEINASDILFIQSSQNYITIHYLFNEKSKKHLLRISLVNAIKQINTTSVLQCHRSYVVNINRVEKITGNAQGLKLTMDDGSIIPVSRSFVKTIKSRLSY